MKNWRIYQNYAIIAILSFISVFFLPMLGSTVGLALNVPTTVVGWIVYVITKLCIVVINMLMLDQFIKQAKVNVRDHEHFKEAETYFNTEKNEEEPILAPKEFLSHIYKQKMITSLIMSILGVFGLSQAILTFDWVSMLSYLFTIIMGLIFGWISMNRVEDYWTNDYYRLYKRDEKIKKDLEVAKSQPNKQRNDSVCTDRGTNILESSNNMHDSCIDKPVVVDGSNHDNIILGGSIHASNNATNSPNLGLKKTL